MTLNKPFRFGVGYWRWMPLFFLTFLSALSLSEKAEAVDAPGLIELAATGDTFKPDFVQTIRNTPPDVLNETRDDEGRTMLHWLAARSHHARVLPLLLAGADVNVKDRRGRTPLFDNLEATDPYAKGEGDFSILEMLVASKADLNVRAADGTTPLAIAVERGDYRKANFLLWSGAEPHPKGVPNEKLPLQIAHSKRDPEIIALIESAIRANTASGAPVRRVMNPNGPGKLSQALTAADLAVISELIASGWNVNEQDAQGRTALLKAVEGGRADLASLLLLEGANPNIASKAGKTPLMASARFLTLEGQRMNTMLLVMGANPAAETEKGLTPLILAVSSGNNWAVLWLLSSGLDPFVETPKGSLMAYATHPPTARLLTAFGLSPVEKELPATPVDAMIEAVTKGDIEGVAKALDGGVLPDATDKNGRTGLSWAVSYGKFDVVDFLLKRGANINRQSKTGHHPLHHLATWGTATGGGNATVGGRYIEELIKRGAWVDIERKGGMTPLMVAAREGAVGANTEALLKAGAQINARNSEGLTPLGIARKHGRHEMMEFLKARGAVE